MNYGTRLTAEKTFDMDSKTLHQKLKYHFRYSTFKNELQEDSVKTILERKCSKNTIFIILTISLLKENLMFSFQCHLDLENLFVINFRLYSIHLKSL